MQGPEIFSGFPSYFGICHFQSVFLLSIINNSHNETYFGKQENKNQLTATYSPQTTCPGGRQELSPVAFHRLKAVLKSTLWWPFLPPKLQLSYQGQVLILLKHTFKSSDVQHQLKHKHGHSMGLVICPSQVIWEGTHRSYFIQKERMVTLEFICEKLIYQNQLPICL